MKSLDQRYDRMQDGMTEVLNQFKAILDEADATDDPRADDFDRMIQTLVISAYEGRRLQTDVRETLFGRLAQSQSARKAYDHGWQDRLVDLLARATPEQIALLGEIVGDE